MSFLSVVGVLSFQVVYIQENPGGWGRTWDWTVCSRERPLILVAFHLILRRSRLLDESLVVVPVPTIPGQTFHFVQLR